MHIGGIFLGCYNFKYFFGVREMLGPSLRMQKMRVTFTPGLFVLDKI